jgi:hypothetical protein
LDIVGSNRNISLFYHNLLDSGAQMAFLSFVVAQEKLTGRNTLMKAGPWQMTVTA